MDKVREVQALIELRELTGCGIEDCKKALDNFDSIQEAAEFLRVKGQAVVRKKVGKMRRLMLYTCDVCESQMEVQHCTGDIPETFTCSICVAIKSLNQ